MTDLDPKAAAPAASRRAALAGSRHLRVEAHYVPSAHTVVMSDLASARPESREHSARGGMWFAVCVALTVVVLVAYDAIIGFG